MIEKEKIYCFVWGSKEQNIRTVALREDGEFLEEIFSGSIEYGKRYIRSEYRVSKYDEHCQHGHVLIWVDEPEKNEGVLRALEYYKLRSVRDGD